MWVDREGNRFTVNVVDEERLQGANWVMVHVIVAVTGFDKWGRWIVIIVQDWC